MSTPETSRYVRLHLELVLEITDPEELTEAALTRIATDDSMPDEERTHARAAVREDEAEALAYLVEPADMVGEVPGVELAQGSWSSELIDYDPESVEWDVDEEDLDDGDNEGGDGANGAATGRPGGL
ncbi:hypothetical protein GCM10011583_54550 [Streptomyces camponoticapitis]|uniref:Uncharacterized protein n=1 Tax=Streptomyces camponoticapitis TaxID=1616125 RepID=A0ABQ2EP29_9ACTN|nr:hypothetical protein [Streptomyces camponoticapitis]GGK15757.1 hypothetical protein GCM10011583_54550 [Streptomyces camponoticapitis]